ncbi:hypothetical protein EVAR_37554_1 [Eumeta japonica]|uniref:Uncharacterized protein n=1 Tax=Eumeta variegata TaxID=151549 RepID=A0A4C1XSU9_EUMVA|nr:hypothetical protein EVAR_37554_1 [Eumeta japonica]
MRAKLRANIKYFGIRAKTSAGGGRPRPARARISHEISAFNDVTARPAPPCIAHEHGLLFCNKRQYEIMSWTVALDSLVAANLPATQRRRSLYLRAHGTEWFILGYNVLDVSVQRAAKDMQLVTHLSPSNLLFHYESSSDKLNINSK